MEKGQFGLNGNSRPKIDGGDTVPANNETALVGSNSQSYITIKNLKVINSHGHGISMKNGSYNTVENCYTYHTYRIGIGLSRMSHSTISNNTVGDAYYWTTVGDGIDVTALSLNGTSRYNKVTRNIVFNCNEGIGIYKKNDYTTVEYNVLYDNYTYNIYVDASKHTTIRYNMIYTSTSGDWDAIGRLGIVVDNEHNRGYCYIDDQKIYGNLIASMKQGIFISNDYGYNVDTSCNTTNVLVYNNTLVDNDINIRIACDDAGWTGNEIKNNISWTITAGTVHTDKYNPTGFTWSHNLFDDAVSGKAANNAVIGDPALKKSSGWRSLKADSLDGTEFSLLSGSKAINAGISIPSYNNRIAASNYTADPITMTILTDGTPDIGAWMRIANEISVPAPKDLVITD